MYGVLVSFLVSGILIYFDTRREAVTIQVLIGVVIMSLMSWLTLISMICIAIFMLIMIPVARYTRDKDLFYWHKEYKPEEEEI